MLSNSRLLSDLWLSAPEPLTQLIAKLTLMDYAMLGFGFGLCLAVISLGLLLRFYQAKTRLLHILRESASPLDLSHHDAMLDHYQQELKGLRLDHGDRAGLSDSALPFAGISKGLLARSYRHAFLVVRQMCLCAIYLQALTGLVVLYTEQYRQRPLPTGPTPAAVLDIIHKLEQALQEPLVALRQMEEPVVWRSDTDIPAPVRHFDASAFWQDAMRTETILLPQHKVSRATASMRS
jgi:hypothetical protein